MTHEIARLNVLRSTRLALAIAMAAGVAGCLHEGKTAGRVAGGRAIDGPSAVARDVAYAARHPGPYPRFIDIPNIPTDIRPASAWRQAVVDLQGQKAALDREAADLPPPLTDTERYAADSRGRAAADPADIPPPDAAQQTEAYAKTLRERATPPPTPK